MIDKNKVKAKAKALLESRRFWTAVVAVLVVIQQDMLGITAEQAKTLCEVVGFWIVGDSLNKTE